MPRYSAAEKPRLHSFAEIRPRADIKQRLAAADVTTQRRADGGAVIRLRQSLGVEARVNGYYVHIGNARYFRSKDIRYGQSSRRVSRFNQKGLSTLLFAVNGELKGLIPYADEVRPEDHRFDSHGITVIVDPKSLPYLDGTELDFAKEGLNEGFKFNNPNVRDACGCGESFNV